MAPDKATGLGIGLSLTTAAALAILVHRTRGPKIDVIGTWRELPEVYLEPLCPISPERAQLAIDRIEARAGFPVVSGVRAGYFLDADALTGKIVCSSSFTAEYVLGMTHVTVGRDGELRYATIDINGGKLAEIVAGNTIEHEFLHGLGLTHDKRNLTGGILHPNACYGGWDWRGVRRGLRGSLGPTLKEDDR
jgi:hypothetical protein